jgi:LysM repeat protein
MALLVAVPLLSLVLIRMLWSGSSLWFLLAGLLFLAGAAVTFLARRPPGGLDFDRQALEMEPNRWPLVLAALGVLFLALLVVPNFAGGGSGGTTVTQQPNTPVGQVLDNTQQPVAQPTVGQQPVEQQPSVDEPAADEPADAPAAGDGDVYVVKSGDSLWSIAQQYSTTVDAIVEANSIADPADLQVGQELVIPAPEEVAAAQ